MFEKKKFSQIYQKLFRRGKDGSMEQLVTFFFEVFDTGSIAKVTLLIDLGSFLI